MRYNLTKTPTHPRNRTNLFAAVTGHSGRGTSRETLSKIRLSVSVRNPLNHSITRHRIVSFSYEPGRSRIPPNPCHYPSIELRY